MLKQFVSRMPVIYKVISKKPLDATEFLQSEHMKVETLFLRLKLSPDPQQKAALFAKICDSLDDHMLAEESVFYPACEKIEELKQRIRASTGEHQEIRDLISSLRNDPPFSPTSPEKKGSDYSDRASNLENLQARIEQHVSEEENVVFPTARKHMSPSKLERLASQMKNRRTRPRPQKRAPHRKKPAAA